MQTDDASIFGDLSRAQMAAGLEPEMQDDETDEVEHEGRFYRVPRALAGAFMANADYARKAQELAELRQGLDRDRQGLSAQAELMQATLADRTRLAAIDDQLEDFEGIDWDTLGEEDPRTAQALWERYQQLAGARERYAWSLTQREHHSRTQAERELAEQMAQTGKILASEIDGWSPEVATKLVEYAAAFGVTLDELREVADPRLWKILHRAHLGDEMVKRQETTRQTEQLQAVRPAVQVGGAGASGGGVRDEMATREWMRRRNDQALRGR
jgi:hypothetical protein